MKGGSTLSSNIENRVVRERFEGRITALTSQVGGGGTDVGGGTPWQSWTLQTSGLLAASVQGRKIETNDDPFTRQTDSQVDEGADTRRVAGDPVILRFEDNRFAALGVGAPMKSYNYPVRQVETHVTVCKGNDPTRQCPPATTDVWPHSESPYQGYAVQRNSPEMVSIEETDRRLRFTWRERTSTAAGGAVTGGTTEVNEVTVDLYRGPGR